MIGNSGLLAAALTVVSVMSLTLLSLLCLRCKRKSKIIHEETQIYNPQIFQRGGSRFAVMESKTVTRANQITTVETPEDLEEFPSATMDESDYENVIDAQTGSPEHTYVAPITESLYENEKIKRTIEDADQTLAVYGNIETFPNGEDDNDYENSDFLGKVVEDDDEPDYVNEFT